jgi:hypothetical protein
VIETLTIFASGVAAAIAAGAAATIRAAFFSVALWLARRDASAVLAGFVAAAITT